MFEQVFRFHFNPESEFSSNKLKTRQDDEISEFCFLYKSFVMLFASRTTLRWLESQKFLVSLKSFLLQTRACYFSYRTLTPVMKRLRPKTRAIISMKTHQSQEICFLSIVLIAIRLSEQHKSQVFWQVLLAAWNNFPHVSSNKLSSRHSTSKLHLHAVKCLHPNMQKLPAVISSREESWPKLITYANLKLHMQFYNFTSSSFNFRLSVNASRKQQSPIFRFMHPCFCWNQIDQQIFQNLC